VSLAGEIAGALALAVLDVGADMVVTDNDGAMIVAREHERVRLILEVRPEPEPDDTRR
jgi:hypothetical protein